MSGYLMRPMPQYTALIYKKHPDAVMPERKSIDAAGYDLCTVKDFKIYPGERVVVPTGLIIQPPHSFHIEILARSGLAYKHGIFLTNSVGLIDRDYAGPEDEIKVMLYMAPKYWPPNVSTNDVFMGYGEVEFKKGDRIAQMVFRQTNWLKFEELSEPPIKGDRGGLGSTGLK